MAYDKHYRARVVKYILDEGHTQKEAAKIFKVGTTSIKNWIAAYKANGTAGGGYTVANRKPRKLQPEALEAYMREHPDAFLKEVAKEFSCCNEGVRKALARGRITLKKRRSATRSGTRRRGGSGRR
jgi:transposase